MSLSTDETMIAVNNAYNGFNLYGVPHRTVFEHFIEPNLHDTSGSVFLSSDGFLVYPESNGVLKVWDVKSRAPAGSVHSMFMIPAKLPHPDGERSPDGQLSQVLAVEVWISWRRFISRHVLTSMLRLALTRVTMGIRCS
jgi:hypothetical protein